MNLAIGESAALCEARFFLPLLCVIKTQRFSAKICEISGKINHRKFKNISFICKI